MSRPSSPFSPKVILPVLVVGAAAFLLFLYAIGAGLDQPNTENGGSHAAANGLNGYSGLVRLLEARGHEVSLSRTPGRLQDEALLVITPQAFADGQEVDEIIQSRRYYGPTLVILPKWIVGPADPLGQLDVPAGWVSLHGTDPPGWLEDIVGLDGTQAAVAERQGWSGLGLSGTFPDPGQVMSISPTGVVPFITDGEGGVLVGYIDDTGSYPVLADAAGVVPRDLEVDGSDTELWPVVVVAEPDLVNNYGLADAARAEAAVTVIDTTLEGYEMPIVFDLTVPGLGRNRNLLTLAFEPPFLAATLCLILAAAVIAWRAFRRFGPPVAEAPVLALGKKQLARNGGGLVERARRWHLLGPPYAALIAQRTATALGIREADPQARDAAIARIQAARGLPADFPEKADALRRARRPHDLLRAAGALRSIERTLSP